MTGALDALVRNVARGRVTYQSGAVAERVAAAILRHGESALSPLNPYLSAQLFTLRKGEWQVLRFTAGDAKPLQRLHAERSALLDRNYAALVGEYVSANTRRVNAVAQVAQRVTAAVLSADDGAVGAALGDLSEIDRQSLFAFRAYSELNAARSRDGLIEYFSQQHHALWVRQRFLYPLISYATSVPDAEHFDHWLSYIIPDGADEPTQGHLMKMLLRDDLVLDQPLAYKAYVALRCHPYDALEMLLNHVELEFARRRKLEPYYAEIVAELDDRVVSPRLRAIAPILTGTRRKFATAASECDLQASLGLEADDAAFYSALMTTDWVPRDRPKPKSDLQRGLSAMRWSRYPSAADFTSVTSTARRWANTDAGRFLHALLTTQYLVQRKSPEEEALRLIRLCGVTGAVTPYLLSSPRGLDALHNRLLPMERISQDQALARCDQAIAEPGRYNDRGWIKAAHWRLRIAERELRVTRWIEMVRKFVPIAPPPYLSGIDWAFVNDVLKRMRIAPFETPAGLYVLLLMHLEDRSGEDPPLRSALDDFIIGRSYGEVVGWLLGEYGQDAIAFIRFFFSAEYILMLKLAPNYTAALAERLNGLESYARAHGFGPLLTEQQLGGEVEELTTNLLWQHVSADKFDIPWAVLRKEVIENETARYSIYLSLRAQHKNMPALLTTARVNSLMAYPNGRTVEYEFKNDDWPLVSLVKAILDAFMHHPSFGIEAILSGRFRHDTLRREFGEALDRLAGSVIPWTPKQIQTDIIAELDGAILLAVQGWANRRLHSQRPGRPDALFDFVPSQPELEGLIEDLRALETFADIVDGVVAWLRSRLELQVAAAREYFQTELAQELRDLVNVAQRDLSHTDRFRKSDVDKVCPAVESAILHRLDELACWFGTSTAILSPLSVADLKGAVDRRYETAIRDGRLFTHIVNCPLARVEIPKEHVRLCFELVSELYANALKRPRKKGARLRISPGEQDGVRGFWFSSLAPEDNAFERTVEGHPYRSLHDEIFREGNSGLAKVAAQSASLLRRHIRLRADRRRQAFHLFVPLAPGGVS